MRILTIFQTIFPSLTRGVLGLALGVYLWSSAWPLALSLDGSDASIAVVLLAICGFLTTASLNTPQWITTLPRTLRALLFALGPALGMGLYALPYWGLFPACLMGLTLGALLGMLAPRGPVAMSPALGLGMGASSFFLHVAPGPSLPLPIVGALLGLWMGSRSPTPRSEAAHPPILYPTLAAPIAGMLFWASHRIWMGFLTPTRSSEGVFLGCCCLLGAIGSLTLKRLSPPALLALSALGIGVARLFLPEMPLAIGLGGFLDHEGWPQLMVALTTLGLLSMGGIALPIGGLLGRGQQGQGALGFATGIALAILLLPYAQAPGLMEASGALFAFSALLIALFNLGGLRRYITFALGLFTILLIGMAPPLPEKLLSSALYPQLLEREGVRRSVSDARGRRPLYVSEDAYGGVAVFPGSDSPSTVIAGAPMGGDGFLSKDMTFLGLLGALLHPDPQRALSLGARGPEAIDLLDRLGMEVTAATLGEARFRALGTRSEPEETSLPTSVEAYTYGVNRALHLKPGHYDLIIAPPQTPWTREGAQAFTQDRYESMARALRPGGVAIVSLPLESLGPEELEAIIAGFLKAFPHALPWLAPSGTRHLLLSGTIDPRPPIPYMSLLGEMNRPELRQSLLELEMGDPGALFARLLGDTSLLTSVSEGAPIPRAWRPHLDVALPRAAYGSLRPHPLTLFSNKLKDTYPLFDPPGEGPSQTQLKETLARSLEANKALIQLLEKLGSGSLDQAMDTLLTLGPGSDKEVSTLIRPYLDRAKRELALGVLEEARAQASFARALAPRSPDPFIILAQISLRENKPHLAEEAYQEALKRDPSETSALLGLADLAQAQGRFGEALGHLEAAKAQLPNSPQVHHNLGEVYRVQGNLVAAQSHFEQAIAIDRSLSKAHAGLALTLLAQNKPQAALPSATMALRLEESALGYETLGQVFLELKDYVRARSALVQCLLRDPEAVPCLGGMGIVYAESDQIDKAREMWNRILDVSPEHPIALENLRRLETFRESERAPIFTLERPKGP